MPRQNTEEDVLKGSPLDLDILGHRLRYSTNRWVRRARQALKRLPGASAAWQYLYLVRRRQAMLRHLPPVPRKIKLELTNACNLRCIMCPNSSMARRRGLMSWELFTRIIDEAARIGVPHVGLYATGESMLHPQFTRMAAYAKARGLYVSVCTNAQLMTPSCARELLDAGVDRMRYSIEGAEKARYESIRRGGTFERLLEHIAYFKQLRDSRQAKTSIWIESVYFGEGFEEARRFRERFAPYADQLFFYPVCNMGGGTALGPQAAGQHARLTPCINLWTTMCLTWDGKATLCNYDFEAETVVGSLRTSTIQEIWRSPAFHRLRELHLQGRQRELPLCGGCSDIRSAPNAPWQPFLVDEQVVRPCLKTSFEAYELNRRIDRYCAQHAAHAPAA